MHYEFEPTKAFNLLDSRKIGYVDAHDITQFLKAHYVSAEFEDAQKIVTEYDANLDGTLTFAEFSQLVLPAANSGLRAIAEQRRYGAYFNAHIPLPYDCVNLIVRLFEKEIILQRHCNEGKLVLTSSPDFIKVRAFNEMSRGFHSVCVPDLIHYLERNGFFPRREDVEAILRRVDHDANQMISYEEFCELTRVVNSATSPESPPKKSDANAADESRNESFSSPVRH